MIIFTAPKPWSRVDDATPCATGEVLGRSHSNTSNHILLLTANEESTPKISLEVKSARSSSKVRCKVSCFLFFVVSFSKACEVV